MATQIQVKRTTGNSLPAQIAPGELIYVGGTGQFYVGDASVVDTAHFVGGPAITGMLDHTAGTLTADSAVIVDANSKIDQWMVDNVKIDGNTVNVTDANGNLTLAPNGTGHVLLTNPYVDAASAGELADITLQAYVEKYGGNTVATQDGLNSTVAGTTVTIGIDDTSIANVKLANSSVTLGTTTVALGASDTDLAGLTSLGVDNIRIGTADAQTITTASGDLNLNSVSGKITTDAYLEINDRLSTTTTAGQAGAFGIWVNGGITTRGGYTNDFAGDNDFGEGGGANNSITLLDGCGFDSNINPKNPDVDGVCPYDLGTPALKWRSLYVDTLNADNIALGNIDVGSGEANTINTTGGNLILDSSNGTVQVNDNMSVTGGVSLDTTLGVTGISTLGVVNAGVTSVSDMTATGTSDLQGAVTIGSAGATTITATGDGTVTGSWAVDNLSMDGNTLASTNTDGDIIIDPVGTGKTIANNFFVNNGVSDIGIQTYVQDISSANLTASAGITYTNIDGAAGAFSLTDAGVTNAKLENNSITIGTDATALGTTITDLNGLTSVDVDDITIDGATVSTAATDIDLALAPNGEGTVTVASGYELRANFGDTSLTNKAYVDSVVQGLDIKESVRVASQSAIDLTSVTTIDGVAMVDGDRVLVRAQTSIAENGIYIWSTGGTLSRSDDADDGSKLDGGTFVFVEEGTDADAGYVMTNNDVITIDVSDITWTQFSGAGSITAGAGMSKTGNTLQVLVAAAGGLEISADEIQIANAGVTTDMIAANAVSLATQVDGVLPVGNGGTGRATITADALVYGNGTNSLTMLAPVTGTAGQILGADATTGAPVWVTTIDGGTY